MVETLGTESLRDLRDRALLLYGFATALRGSELVRLQVVDMEAREKGDVVTIGFSKGDQAGEGQTVAALAVPGSPYCPVTVLRVWLQAAGYVRHKPEQTLLYQLVEQYWPEFQTQLSETGRFLPRHVTREFEDYLACSRLENGFLRVRCHSCSHEHLVAFSCTNSRRFRRTTWLLH